MDTKIPQLTDEFVRLGIREPHAADEQIFGLWMLWRNTRETCDRRGKGAALSTQLRLTTA